MPPGRRGVRHRDTQSPSAFIRRARASGRRRRCEETESGHDLSWRGNPEGDALRGRCWRHWQTACERTTMEYENRQSIHRVSSRDRVGPRIRGRRCENASENRNSAAENLFKSKTTITWWKWRTRRPRRQLGTGTNYLPWLLRCKAVISPTSIVVDICRHARRKFGPGIRNCSGYLCCLRMRGNGSCLWNGCYTGRYSYLIHPFSVCVVCVMRGCVKSVPSVRIGGVRKGAWRGRRSE
jgi:hypothetical protein